MGRESISRYGTWTAIGGSTSSRDLAHDAGVSSPFSIWQMGVLDPIPWVALAAVPVSASGLVARGLESRSQAL